MSASANGTPQIQWSTAITAVEPDLLYRGYRVEELLESTSFLDTAFLLVTGELPTSEQFADWQALLMQGMYLPDSIASWITRVPAVASPMDVLAGVLTRIRLAEGPTALTSTQGIHDSLPQWLGFLTSVLASRVRWARGERPGEPRDDLSFSGNLWWMLQGREPSPLIEQSLERLLMLGADHGMSPSTVAVRLAAAAGADFPIAVQAGASVAASWQPVGQAAATLDVLTEVRSPDRARAWVDEAVTRQRPIAGFEHRIYRVGDPRADWIAPLCRKAAERTGRLDREALAESIEGAVWDRLQRLPSIVWPAARLLDALGVDRAIFGPLFVIARLSGWAAHYLEQRDEQKMPVTTTTYQGPEPRSLPTSADTGN